MLGSSRPGFESGSALSFISWVTLSEPEFAHVYEGVPGPRWTITWNVDLEPWSLGLVTCLC